MKLKLKFIYVILINLLLISQYAVAGEKNHENEEYRMEEIVVTAPPKQDRRFY